MRGNSRTPGSTLTMFKSTIILGLLFVASVCHAYTEISWWTFSDEKDRVVEFLSEDIKLYCHGGCKGYTVSGRPDEIFVSSIGEYSLTLLRRGDAQRLDFRTPASRGSRDSAYLSNAVPRDGEIHW